MKKISYGLIGLSLLLFSVTSASAEISIGIGLPNVSIGINLPLFPQLVRVPNYPVYYAPRLDANYFFYDGMYWIYQDDYWYASSWYNGPWGIVEPEFVPLYILRIPVRYYRQPPAYFREWRSNEPPRWGQHWGRDWEKRRSGWDRWNRRSAPAPAPLPVYQRQYSGERYPQTVERQHELRDRSYRYQPRDKDVRQHYKRQTVQQAPAPAQRERQHEPPMRVETPRSAPPQQRGPVLNEQRQQPGFERYEQKAPRVKEQQPKQQQRDELREPNRDQRQWKDRDEDRGRGQDRGEERGKGRDR